MKIGKYNLSANVSGAAVSCILIIVYILLETYGQHTAANAVLVLITGQLLPQPHSVSADPETIIIQDEHGVKHDA